MLRLGPIKRNPAHLSQLGVVVRGGGDQGSTPAPRYKWAGHTEFAGLMRPLFIWKTRRNSPCLFSRLPTR